MQLGKLGARGGFGSGGALAGASNPAVFADFLAPSGFHWEFVTDDATGERITDEMFNNEPVVDLVGNS